MPGSGATPLIPSELTLTLNPISRKSKFKSTSKDSDGCAALEIECLFSGGRRSGAGLEEDGVGPDGGRIPAP